MKLDTDDRQRRRSAGAPDEAPTTVQNAQARERYSAIAGWLSAEGRIDVVDVATRLGVAQETIRRDLRTMERAGKLVRVHGGAVRVDSGPPAVRPPVAPTDPAGIEVSLRVWSALPRQGTVLIGTGPLSLALAHTIVAAPPEERGLTVVTNSLDAAVVLSRASRVEVYNIGGTVAADTRAQEGDWAVHELARLHVDVGVVCPAGISVERGLTQATPAAAAVSQAEVAASDRVIALVPAEVLGTSSFVRFADLDQIAVIEVAGRPAPAAQQPFLERGIQLNTGGGR